MERKRKGIKVLTWPFARALSERGFKQIGIQPNFQKPLFNVYIFEATPECQAFLEYLIEEKKNGVAISPDDKCESCGTKENLSLEALKMSSTVLCESCYLEEINEICNEIEEDFDEDLEAL